MVIRSGESFSFLHLKGDTLRSERFPIARNPRLNPLLCSPAHAVPDPLVLEQPIGARMLEVPPDCFCLHCLRRISGTVLRRLRTYDDHVLPVRQRTLLLGVVDVGLAHHGV